MSHLHIHRTNIQNIKFVFIRTNFVLLALKLD